MVLALGMQSLDAGCLDSLSAFVVMTPMTGTVMSPQPAYELVMTLAVTWVCDNYGGP